MSRGGKCQKALIPGPSSSGRRSVTYTAIFSGSLGFAVAEMPESPTCWGYSAATPEQVRESGLPITAIPREPLFQHRHQQLAPIPLVEARQQKGLWSFTAAQVNLPCGSTRFFARRARLPSQLVWLDQYLCRDAQLFVKLAYHAQRKWAFLSEKFRHTSAAAHVRFQVGPR